MHHRTSDGSFRDLAVALKPCQMAHLRVCLGFIPLSSSRCPHLFCIHVLHGGKSRCLINKTTGPQYSLCCLPPGISISQIADPVACRYLEFDGFTSQSLVMAPREFGRTVCSPWQLCQTRQGDVTSYQTRSPVCVRDIRIQKPFILLRLQGCRFLYLWIILLLRKRSHNKQQSFFFISWCA